MHTPSLDEHAASVTDEAAGLATPSPEDDIARKMGFMARAKEKMAEAIEALAMVERSLGTHLPDAIRDAPLGDAVDLLSELHILMSQLTNDGQGGGVVEQVKRRIKFVKEVTLPTRFDEQKIKTFSTENFRVTKTNKVFASILPGENEAAYNWLRKNDLEGLIKETVNASSLSATAKELMESGKELPDDMFRAHFQAGTSVTKLKKG